MTRRIGVAALLAVLVAALLARPLPAQEAETPPPAAHAGHHDHHGMGHGEMEDEEAAGEHAIERTPATAPIEPYFVSPEMERARAKARREMGGGRFLMLDGERIEWHSGEGAAAALLEGQAWYGGDMNRLWVKPKAELLIDAPSGVDELETAEIQVLYGRPISPFFDLQVGARHDLEPSPSRTFAVVGVQGLAPLWFEVDLALFVSEDGDFSSRLEAEYELLFTQKLMLQLRSEVDLEGSDVPELGLGSGLSRVEAGIRLSHGRVLAPYIGVSWERTLGGTADYLRARGEETEAVSAVAGLRFWY
ncbi:MAG: copper resistance protein B [Thermoanaerobaculia bacterium]|nr:copper resistance protein B [Thermoanaerobaculia bacterium]